MRLLFAEDDRDISKAVQTLLERSGYSVDAVYNGQDALDYIEQADYDGVILDWMMPKKTGIEVLAWMRGKGISTPVLMLTARDAIEDRVEGLDTGDMILTEKIAIGERMTASELHDALSAMGASLIVKTLAEIEAGTAPRTLQTDENTCYASMINKDMCRIDFSKPIDDVYNLIRGMSASPCAFTTLGGKRFKVYFAEKTDIKT